MTLAHINQFETNDPTKLGRQLSDLEDRVSAELDAVRAASVALPAIATFIATTSKSIVPARFGQQLSVDTFIASASVILPPLTPANYGQTIMVIKRKAANSIVVMCQDATVTCNGGAFPTITAVGISGFYCDSSGYYT